MQALIICLLGYVLGVVVTLLVVRPKRYFDKGYTEGCNDGYIKGCSEVYARYFTDDSLKDPEKRKQAGLDFDGDWPDFYRKFKKEEKRWN